jgi:hypothetical protein
LPEGPRRVSIFDKRIESMLSGKKEE